VGCSRQPPAPAAPQPIDLEGVHHLIRETANQNKVLVIDVWATWCVPCIEAFPRIHQGMERFGDKVRLVSLSFDLGESEKDANEFLKEQHAMHDAYITTDGDARATIAQELGKKSQAVSPPMIYVFDQKGNMVA